MQVLISKQPHALTLQTRSRQRARLLRAVNNPDTAKSRDGPFEAQQPSPHAHRNIGQEWQALNLTLTAHACEQSDLLPRLLHAHALTHTARPSTAAQNNSRTSTAPNSKARRQRSSPLSALPTERFPLLLPTLLASQPEQAALQHLLFTPSPWQPRSEQQAIGQQELRRTGLFEDVWREHDEEDVVMEGVSDATEGVEMQNGSASGDEDGQAQGALDAQLKQVSTEDAFDDKQQLQGSFDEDTQPPTSALTPLQQLQQIKQALGVGGGSSDKHSPNPSTPYSISSEEDPQVWAARQRHKLKHLSPDRSAQRMCVLQLAQAATRHSSEMQAEEAAACALLLAQLALAADLLPGTRVSAPDSDPSPPTPSNQLQQQQAGAVQQGLRSLIQRCLERLQLGHDENHQHRPNTTDSSTELSTSSVDKSPSSPLAVLAVVAAASALCLRGEGGVRDASRQRRNTSSSARDSKSSRDSSGNSGNGKDEPLEQSWCASVRQLAQGMLAETGVMSDDQKKKVEVEALAAVLWTQGVAKADCGSDSEARSCTLSLLGSLQPHLPLLSNKALLDVLWVLPAVRLLPLPPTSPASHLSSTASHSSAGGESASNLSIAESERGTDNSTQQRDLDLPISDPPAQLRVALPPSEYPLWLACLVGEVVQPHRLSAMSGRQLVGLLVTLAQAQVRLHGLKSSKVLSALHGCLRRDCPTLNAHQLSLTLWALAKTRTCMRAQMLARVLSRFHDLLPQATVVDVAFLVWALPLVSRRYTQWIAPQQPHLLRALSEHTLPHLTAAAQQQQQQHSSTDRNTVCGPRQLVQLALGFMRLGYYPGADWMRRHRAACIAMQHTFLRSERAQLRASYQKLLEE